MLNMRHAVLYVTPNSRSSCFALIRRDRWPESRQFVVLMPQHDGGDVAGALCPDPKEIDTFLRFATEHYDVDAGGCT